MEVSNRFDFLASLSVDDPFTESVSNDVIVTKQIENVALSTRNFWDVPEYVDKPIPCVVPVTAKEDRSKPVVKAKSARQRSKMIPKKIDQHSQPEDEQNEEVEISATVEVQSQPASVPYYPPQPYKFKPANASKIDISLPMKSIATVYYRSSQWNHAEISSEKFFVTKTYAS